MTCRVIKSNMPSRASDIVEILGHCTALSSVWEEEKKLRNCAPFLPWPHSVLAVGRNKCKL